MVNKQMWCIVLKMPSGQLWAFSQYQDCFALVPFNEHNQVKNAVVWDTEEEARTAYDKTTEQMVEKGMTPFHEIGEISFRNMARLH